MSQRKSKSKFLPAAGLSEFLHDKSKSRRDNQAKLATLRETVSPRRNNMLPSLRVEYVAIDQLREAPRQLRRNDAVQAARLDRSIAEFGVCQPVLVDENSCIIHGHGIWHAARRAGLSQIPVIWIEHLSEPKRRALAITLNRLAETGTWDEQALRVEFDQLLELGEDITVSGFDLEEIDALLLDDDSTDPDSETIPALPSVAVSRTGDIWILGDHILLQGDSLDPANYEILLEGDDQGRLVLTDPPFNVPNLGHVTSNAAHPEFAMAYGEMSDDQFSEFNKCWMHNAILHLVDGGIVATFIDWRSIEIILAAGRALGLKLLNLVVWNKSNGGQGSLWRSKHELLPVFKNGDASHVNNVELGRFGRWRSNVWDYPGASSVGSDSRAGLKDHPTVKPRALLEDAILDVSNRGDIILDPFLGSGSTLVAAEATGRRCRAIEIEGGYCDVAISRWQVMTGQSAILRATGDTFAEVERQRLDDSNLDVEGADDVEARS